MKLLRWIFDIAYQYREDRRRYEKKGPVNKIISAAVVFIFAGLVMWLVWWAVGLFDKTFIGGIFASILAGAFVLGFAKTSIIYTIIAFSSCANRAVSHKIADGLDRRFEIKDGDIIKREEKLTDEQLEKFHGDAEVRKQARTVDIIVGVLYLIASIAIVLGSIGMLGIRLALKI